MTLYFVGAVLTIFMAHLARIARWELFIEIYEKPQKRSLFRSLSVGFILNYILPFKLGDIIRAFMAGSKMKSGKALGFSTVIVDRYIDIVAVGFIFAILTVCRIGNVDSMSALAQFYILMALALLACAIIFYLLRGFAKKSIRRFAGLFNDKIECAILCFAWALIWNFKDIYQKINKWKLLFSTVAMWVLYLLSYHLFALFLSGFEITTSWIDVFLMLFDQKNLSESTGSATILLNQNLVSMHPIYMVLYMLLPLLILFVLSLILKNQPTDNAKQDNYLNLLPHIDPSERLTFLENYFSNKNSDYITNYLKINQNISIIRDYSAGSNATTMLCMDHEQTFFRKYAFGNDGKKLHEQVMWIMENEKALPLPSVLRHWTDPSYCFYDMPYDSHSVGFFEYIHSMPAEQSFQMIQDVFEHLKTSIYTMNRRNADIATIHQYIDTKVTKNLEKIKASKRLSSLYAYDKIIINGKEYRNLSYYEKFLSKQYLEKIFMQDDYAIIHGDLTVENIICTRSQDGKDAFYLIDPNTGNLHDSPSLDYGKLLQSIHGGYEFFMSTKEVTVSGNHVDFLFTRSSAYIELYNRFCAYMKDTLDADTIKSCYFHEIIHWLRLMPYKIEKDEKRAILFYAGLIMTLDDIAQMYID